MKNLNSRFFLFLLCFLPLVAGAQVIAGGPSGGDPHPKDTVHAYNICFPADIEIRNCTVPPAPKILLDELGECDMLAVQIEESTYRASGSSGCYKIFRTYTVINWCAYKEDCGSRENQVFVVNRNAPDFDGTLGKGVCVLVRDADKNGYPEAYYSDDLIADPEEQFSIPISCRRNAHPLWRYTQIVKVFDQVPPVIQPIAAGPFPLDYRTCRGNAVLRFQVSDDCTGPVFLEKIELAGTPGGVLQAPGIFSPGWSKTAHVSALSGGVYEVRLNNLPLGKYDLGVLFRDDCGNLSKLTRIPFEMEDHTAPAPVCYHGLSTALMSDEQSGGTAVVWATDLIASPVYDCQGQGPETLQNNPQQKRIKKFSINRVGSPVDPDQTHLVFSCADAGDSVLVELHAWDTLQNHGYCRTYVKIQDNRLVCPQTGGLSLSGRIATESGNPVEKVEIIANGNGERLAASNAQGWYGFSGLESGYDYTLAPFFNENHTTGLSTRDLILLQKHLLGVELLTSPYQWIAADLNRSGAITISDLLILQKMLLGKLDRFPDNTSWRFVDAGYAFPDPENPLKPGFPEALTLNNLQVGDTAMHFIAVKVGDLNESALQPIHAETRSERPEVFLDLVNFPLRVATLTAIPVVLPESWAGVEGLSLHFRLLPEYGKIVEIQPGRLTAEQFSWDPETGQVSVVASVAGLQTGGNVLFTLGYEGIKTGYLKEALRVGATTGVNEVNLGDGTDRPFYFRFFPDKDLSKSLALPGNFPNPFDEGTCIRFEALEAGEVELIVRDIQGRLVWSEKSVFQAGLNSWMLSGNSFPGQGMYSYLVRGSWGAVSGSMVKMQAHR